MTRVVLDLGPHDGEPAFDLGRRRQRRERLFGLALAGGGLVAARGEPRLRLAERREARRIAAGLAFGFRMPVARGVGQVLRFAPAGARIGLGLGGSGDFGFRRRDRRVLGLDLAAHRLQFGLDVGEPVLAGEPPRGAGRRIGGDREPVPAPEIAVARDQPLSGLEQLGETLGVGRARPRRSGRAGAPAPSAP